MTACGDNAGNPGVRRRQLDHAELQPSGRRRTSVLDRRRGGDVQGPGSRRQTDQPQQLGRLPRIDLRPDPARVDRCARDGRGSGLRRSGELPRHADPGVHLRVVRQGQQRAGAQGQARRHHLDQWVPLHRDGGSPPAIGPAAQRCLAHAAWLGHQRQQRARRGHHRRRDVPSPDDDPARGGRLPLAARPRRAEDPDLERGCGRHRRLRQDRTATRSAAS